jgi:hypothetical protein
MDEVERRAEFARIPLRRFKHSTRCADLETHPPTAAGDGRRHFFLATHRAKSFASALALTRNLAIASFPDHECAITPPRDLIDTPPSVSTEARVRVWPSAWGFGPMNGRRVRAGPGLATSAPSDLRITAWNLHDYIVVFATDRSS